MRQPEEVIREVIREVILKAISTEVEQEWLRFIERQFPPTEAQLLLDYLPTVLDVLRDESKKVLLDNTDQAVFDHVDRLWIRIHNLYKLRNFHREAYFIIRQLYPFIRDHEILNGAWWHKGNSFWMMALNAHQLGFVMESRIYFILALLEDVLAHRFAKGRDPITLPAFSWLSNAVGYTHAQVTVLLQSCLNAVGMISKWEPTEPERTYIRSLCRLEHLMEDFPPLPFLSVVANALFMWTSNLSGTSPGGEALEVLTCYLCETSPGFRAAMRARGPDAKMIY